MTAPIFTATRAYEAWLSHQVKPVDSDLRYKHKEMAADPFSFLRATFYRWMQLWPTVCAALATAPRVLAVGDLHAANFGTWHDQDDRLIWGVNDFDEAYPLPYTQDLVRLAASVLLAIRDDTLPISGVAACAAVVEGYTEGLDSHGRPFVLAEEHANLRSLVSKWQDHPAKFWRKAKKLQTAKNESAELGLARRVLDAALPGRGLAGRIVTRRGGLGSLGRPRFVAIAEWDGGQIGREVKAVVPSACVWAADATAKPRIYIDDLLGTAMRCGDPFLSVQGDWLCRRFGPESGRLELGKGATKREAHRLLHAMGYETANVHHGSRRTIRAVRKHLSNLPSGWLHAAAKVMETEIMVEWKQWKTCRKRVRQRRHRKH